MAAIASDAMQLQIETVSLWTVTREVLDLVQPLADEPTVRLYEIDTDVRVRADSRRLREVLINLVTNSVRYSRSGGWVRVSAKDSDPGVTASVSDSGCGIPNDRLDRLFTPFDRRGAERGHETGRGLGDGSLARTFTDAIGDVVRIHTVEGVRTTVELVFPAEVRRTV